MLLLQGGCAPQVSYRAHEDQLFLRLPPEKEHLIQECLLTHSEDTARDLAQEPLAAIVAVAARAPAEKIRGEPRASGSQPSETLSFDEESPAGSAAWACYRIVGRDQGKGHAGDDRMAQALHSPTQQPRTTPPDSTQALMSRRRDGGKTEDATTIRSAPHNKFNMYRLTWRGTERLGAYWCCGRCSYATYGSSS